MSTASAPVNKVIAPRWAWLAGTFFGAGKLRPGPGTWGSLAALVIWRAVAGFLPRTWLSPTALFLAAASFIVGTLAAGRVARELGAEDPSCVVIDEVSGQWLALAAAPLDWKSLLAAFILFRAFDILKPPPLRHLERIPGGAGIMLDDIGAGLYAAVVVRLLLHWGVLK